MTTAKQNPETVFVTDIIMRVLAGRNLKVCLDSLASAIFTLASDVEQEGRDYIASQTANLSESISKIKDEESPQMDAFDNKPKLSLVNS